MADKYSLSMRVIHWLMAVIVISLLIIGLVMTDISRDDPLRKTLYDLHKSFGIIVFLLCILRILVRSRATVPPLPEIIPLIERVLARSGHYLFYLLMLAMPVSGYLMVNSFGFSVKLFGIDLPKIVNADREFGSLMSDFHSAAGFTFIGIIGLHVMGVIKHYLKERVNLLRRMF